MPLFTSEYLKRQSSESLILESKRLFSSQNKSNLKFDIFLSHSYLDRDEVFGLYRELTSMGYSVYVDWIVDSDLDRTNVTKLTAEIIRNRMKNSKSLLLAISSNAAISKWMPWELGYIDGNTERCAIIPVVKDSTNQYSFNRVEYLLLYPYLDRAATIAGNQNKIWVNADSNNYILFEQWMRGSNP